MSLSDMSLSDMSLTVTIFCESFGQNRIEHYRQVRTSSFELDIIDNKVDGNRIAVRCGPVYSISVWYTPERYLSILF